MFVNIYNISIPSRPLTNIKKRENIETTHTQAVESKIKQKEKIECYN